MQSTTAIEMANNLLLQVNGGWLAELVQANMSSITDEFYWLNKLIAIQTIQVIKNENNGSQKVTIEPSGFRYLFVGGLVWMALLPSLALILCFAPLARYAASKLFNIGSKRLKEFAPPKSDDLATICSRSELTTSIDDEKVKRKACTYIIQYLLILALTLLSLLALIMLLLSINTGHEVHLTLQVRPYDDPQTNSQPFDALSASVKFSAQRTQLFLNNSLVQLTKNIRLSCDAAMADINRIVLSQLNNFTTILMKHFFVTQSFQAADDLFSRVDALLLSETAIQNFAVNGFQKLNEFDGQIYTIRNMMQRCCSSGSFCTKLLAAQDQLFCQTTMAQLNDLVLGINAQMIDFNSAQMLLFVVQNYGIDIEQIESTFNTSVTLLHKILQSFNSRVQQTLNATSILNTIVPLIDKVTTTMNPIDNVLNQVKSTGIDLIIMQIHTIWYSLFIIISILHSVLVLFVFYVYCQSDIRKVVNRPRAASLVDKNNSFSSPFDKPIFTTSTILLQGEHSFVNMSFQQEQHHFELNHLDHSFHVTNVEDMRFRRSSYKKAINYEYLVERDRNDSHTKSFTTSNSTMEEVGKPFGNKMHLACMLLIVFLCIFSLCNFYVGSVLQTQVCRYLNTEVGITQSDKLLNQFINQTFAPLLAKLGNSVDDVISLNLRAPTDVLKAISSGCQPANATLLGLIGLENIINATSLTNGQMFQSIVSNSRTLAISAIRGLNLSSLIPLSVTSDLAKTKILSANFVDNNNYQSTLIELQKPLLLLRQNLTTYVQQLENISNLMQRQKASDMEVYMFGSAISLLSEDTLVIYNTLSQQLMQLKSNFITLQNTRNVTQYIEILSMNLNNLQRALSDSSYVINFMSNTYDQVTKTTTSQIVKALQDHLTYVEQTAAPCRSLYEAYNALTYTLCGVTVPKIISFGALHALATLLLQVALVLAMILVWMSGKKAPCIIENKTKEEEGKL